MLKLDSLRPLFVRELNDLYDAEHQLLRMLPGFARAASCKDLRMHFETHVDHAQEHVRRLEGVFVRFDEQPAQRTCNAIKGILEEAGDMVCAEGSPSIRDAGLISAAQRFGHFEMTCYGCARTYAHILGDELSAGLLQESLNDERATDEWLTELAGRLIQEAFVPAQRLLSEAPNGSGLEQGAKESYTGRHKNDLAREIRRAMQGREVKVQ
jgi:ferritin-like metal-binding protein YciE